MAKLIILLATFVVLAVSSEAAKSTKYTKFMSRRDPFSEPENSGPVPKSVVLSTITQRVDNFNPQNFDTFEQRYYQNGEFFHTGGPIFLFLGGEWEITPYRLTESHMAQMARELFGYIFYLEHRYYGQTYPTENVSDENLQFLSVPQVLADIANFISHIKQHHVTPGAEDSPVILVGAHYSASLAVWFRQKFPHLALGVWASSAPVLGLVDHAQYKEITGAVYRQYGGEECYGRLERGFAEIGQLLDNGQASEVTNIFRLCTDITGEFDISVFFSGVSEFYALIAQWSTPEEIEYICNVVTDDVAETDAHAIALIIQGILADEECIEIEYEQLVERDRAIEWDSEAVISGFRQYSYQSCTQFGWYHSSNSTFQPFGNRFPVDIFYKACADVFGERFTEAVINENTERFNTIFGGHSLSDVTNIVYTHGEMDPWRSLGVLESPNPSSPVFITRGAGQAQDLALSAEGDHQNLVDLRYQITEIVRHWVAEESGDGGIVPV